MTDARERMARALCCPGITCSAEDETRNPPPCASCDAASYYDEADAALAVARELVADAVPEQQVADADSLWEMRGHNAARAAVLRALGEVETESGAAVSPAPDSRGAGAPLSAVATPPPADFGGRDA